MGVMKEIATRMATDHNLAGQDPESKVMRMLAQRPWIKQELANPPRIASPARPAQNQRKHHWRKHWAAVLATFTLSFGSYRGWPLEEIPIDYLRWMLTAKNIPVADRWAAERYLQALTGPGRHRGAARG